MTSMIWLWPYDFLFVIYDDELTDSTFCLFLHSLCLYICLLTVGSQRLSDEALGGGFPAKVIKVGDINNHENDNDTDDKTHH